MQVEKQVSMDASDAGKRDGQKYRLDEHDQEGLCSMHISIIFLENLLNEMNE